MSVLLTALVVMAISLALTGVSTLAMRRVARARGDEEMLARVRFAGTTRQRRTSLWLAAGVAGWGVIAGLAGSSLATTLAALSLALAGQAAVLELLAKRGPRDDAGARGAV
jgi:hypothetical protein